MQDDFSYEEERKRQPMSYGAFPSKPPIRSPQVQQQEEKKDPDVWDPPTPFNQKQQRENNWNNRPPIIKRNTSKRRAQDVKPLQSNMAMQQGIDKGRNY